MHAHTRTRTRSARPATPPRAATMDTATYHVAQPSMMLDEDVSDEAMSAIDAMFLHGTSLSDFERDEILQYREVFFVGPQARKIEGVRGAPRNCGFDDASGRYRARLLDHVAYRYKLISMLGKGAFGDCFRAFDFKRSKFVALKIIRNEPRFHRQGKIEVNVLDMLRAHDADDQYSLVHMEDSMLFRNHLCITFELLGDDLYSELKGNNFAGFELPAVRDIAEDTLQCLELLGRLQIVHADLKPENILLRPAEDEDGSGPADEPARVRAKVIDFGSSCFAHGKIHTYIQSRYYRSPEIVLGLGYGPAIDMWSLGCILVELETGTPLFPAKNEQDLLLYHMELLGLPQDDVTSRASRAGEFFAHGRPLRQTDRKGRLHPIGSRQLEDVLQSPEPVFLDFLRKCLTWDPADRMTAAQALRHPWVVGGSPRRQLHQHLEQTPTSSHLLADKMQLDDGGLQSLGTISPRRVRQLMHEDSDLNDSGLSSGDEGATDSDAVVPCFNNYMTPRALTFAM